jgi:glycosyl hydrolase family 123
LWAALLSHPARKKDPADMKRSAHLLLHLIVMSSAVAVFAATPAPAKPVAKTVLGGRSLWRVRIVWETDEVELRDGSVGHYHLAATKSAYREWRKTPTITDFKPVKKKMVRIPADTPADWMKPDFDDSTWVRSRLSIFAQDPVKVRRGGWGSSNASWTALLLRGRFEVPDPATAKDLTLSLGFRGGTIAYLNGEEIGRSFMPLGDADIYTNAQPYPEEAYLLKTGQVISKYDVDRLKDTKERVLKRCRTATVTIPAAKLKKGVNVLAVSVHRPPAHWKYYTTRVKPYAYGVYDSRASARWCRMGLWRATLAAAPGSSVVPNVSAAKDAPFTAWNHSLLRRVYASDYADPYVPLQPVRLAGVRNGRFAAQVIVGGGRPITGLKTETSELKGPAGSIPAEAVTVQYVKPDGQTGAYRRELPKWFESLEGSAPAKVPVYKGGSSVQPLWITVAVPKDAKPGRYSGQIAVSAEGVKPLAVPLEIEVFDWTMPDPREYTAYFDVFQSPGSLAIEYKVPMWSDEHWALIDQSFAHLGQLGLKTLYITCVRRTHLGNEHSMVRWVRGKDGKLTPDLSIAEKYLDVAMKHVGKVPGIIFYCWEPPNSMGHAGSGPGRTHDRKILITVVDPKTGKLSKEEGPKWGTPECKAFWKTFSDAIRPMLKKRDVEGSLMFGLLGDHRPTKQAMDNITTGLPKRNPGWWALHSHNYCHNWLGHDIGMCVALWGIKSNVVEPEKGHGYGWKNPFWLSYYPRPMKPTAPIVDYRIIIESRLSSVPWNTGRWPKARGIRGIGRFGAEFWKVLKDKRGRRRASLAARYPETYWGQLCLNYGVPYILGMGKNGPLATGRSEAFRENMQEIEARVFIEKALLDKAKNAKLGADLARRCREELDTRIRCSLRASGEGSVWFISSGWEQRTRTLFALAAEVQEKLAG